MIIRGATISLFALRSFSFITKTPPAAVLLKMAAGISKGSGEPNKDKVGKVKRDQVRKIAEQKMPDLNTTDVEAAMRTVEGDLGMRWGAPGIVSAMSEARRKAVETRLNCDLAAAARSRHENPGFLPDSDRERAIDRALNEAAITIAIERHAGRVIVRHRPWGDRYQVEGKDLRACRLLVATGGAFRHDVDPKRAIRDALASISAVQAPRNPFIALDRRYALFAVGLIARLDPALARKLTRQIISPVNAEQPATEGSVL